jgi:hypothetical protein
MPIDELLDTLDDDTLNENNFKGILSYNILQGVKLIKLPHIFSRELPINYLQKTTQEFVDYMKDIETMDSISEEDEAMFMVVNMRKGLRDFLSAAEDLGCNIIYESIRRNEENVILSMKPVESDLPILSYSYVKPIQHSDDKPYERVFELKVTIDLGDIGAN